MFTSSKTRMPSEAQALPGRPEPLHVENLHFVLGTRLKPPFPASTATLMVGMGCFWGAEKVYWQAPGVYTTAVGYSAGFTLNPTYQEVCSGLTGHNEVVLVVFDLAETSLEKMLALFWENHDPTQGMRQGNDVGTQYRSGVYVADDHQQQVAESTRDVFAEVLPAARYGQITTEILPAGDFYYAEGYHQQYLAKNPRGYCGLGGTGLRYPS